MTERTAPPPDVAALMTRLGGGGGDAGRRLGGGGEAAVYALDGDRVLRVMHKPADVDELLGAYRRWASAARGAAFPAIPEMLDTGTEPGSDGLAWQVVRRIPGVDVADLLRRLDPAGRQVLLERFVDVSARVSRLETAESYGTVLGGLTYPSWAACLRARLEVPAAHLHRRLGELVPELPAIAAQFDEEISTLYTGPPRLVHVDYFPGNVLAAIGPDGQPQITGVLDFGAHSLYGDPALDIVGAVAMADIFTDVTPAEQQRMADQAAGYVGSSWPVVLRCYRVFYALYYAMDEAELPWCARTLRQAGTGRFGPAD